MKLKEYIELLNEIIEDDPRVLEFDVVYAIDEEWNDFKPVFDTWTIWRYEDGEFTQYEDDEWEEIITVENWDTICIN